MKCSLLVLSSYLDGELESRRQGELEAHLVGCQRCRAGLGYLREEVERISSLGRVRVADHSVQAMLVHLGLVDEDDAPVERTTAVAVAEPPWLTHDALPGWPPPPHAPEPDSAETTIDMIGSAAGSSGEGDSPEERPSFRWVTPADAPTLEHASAAAAALPETGDRPEAPPTVYEPPPLPPPPFTWRPAPPSPERDQGVPAVPFSPDATSPAVPPAPAPELEPPRGADPPSPAPEWPPPALDDPDQAPSAVHSGGAFPPGGPEPSELLDHATAPGGEPEMTASPPWAPHDAPPEPVYPLTDDDVLDHPIAIERFGPPRQANRPNLFERLRDRLATRRALARSAAAYDDTVQIVSGSGAPLRFGRARLEVERRRQETLRMDPGAVPGDEFAEPGVDDALEDDLGLGPLPPPAMPLGPSSPMPRPAPRVSALGGQMPLPGTADASGPLRPLSPPGHAPVPPPRHTLGSALGDVIPPPRPPMPPAIPPLPPRPDPLGEALADLDREQGAANEHRPWRPREIPEDAEPVAAPPRPSAGQVPGPSQLREGRRLLALFGAATLLMLVVGIVSGRTTSPLPSSSTSAPSARTATPPRTQATHPAAKASAAPTQITLGPSAQAPQPPAPAGALTGIKVLGDGGSGYQVRDFRYGIHPGDFRIVLDLDAAGTASGAPKATLGFLDATTLVVVLDGVVAAGSTGQLPSSNPVVSVTLMPQSPIAGGTAYQIKLAHPVTFAAGYATSPLRLVIDIAG